MEPITLKERILERLASMQTADKQPLPIALYTTFGMVYGNFVDPDSRPSQQHELVTQLQTQHAAASSPNRTRNPMDDDCITLDNATLLVNEKVTELPSITIFYHHICAFSIARINVSAPARTSTPPDIL